MGTAYRRGRFESIEKTFLLPLKSFFLLNLRPSARPKALRRSGLQSPPRDIRVAVMAVPRNEVVGRFDTHAQA
jgi:hypothetical protein